MGQRGSAEKKKADKSKGREEFEVAPVEKGLLSLSRANFEQLSRLLTVRGSIALAQTCKISNNRLFKACIDCFDATLPLPLLHHIVTVGYWKLSGMSVKLEDGENLGTLPPGGLGTVRRLRVKCQLVDVDLLAETPELQLLSVTWCRQLVDLSGIRSCANLLTASLVGCNFTDVSPFAPCQKLHTLDLSYSEELKQVTGIGDCSSLRVLRLHNCTGLADVSGLGSSRSVVNLDLSGCTSLADITPLANINTLEVVNLSNNLVLADVTPLVSCPVLHNLDLSSVRELVNVNVLAQCPSLVVLNISCCFRVTDWTELSSSPTITALSTGGLDMDGVKDRDSLSYASMLARNQRNS